MSQITKRALAQSLKDLLKEKPLSKITISDITDSVGVSRHTFYYHFQDIYSLIIWILQEEGETAIGQNKTITTWSQGFSMLCEYVLANKTFILGIYRSDGKDFLRNYFRSEVRLMLHNIVEDQSRPYRVSEREKNLTACFYADGIVGLVMDWVDRNMEDDYHFMLSTLERILQGEINDALQRLSH